MTFNNNTFCRTVPTCKAVQLDGGVEGPELLLEGVHRLDQPPELGLGSVGGLSLGNRDNISGRFAGTVVILQSVSISTRTPAEVLYIVPFLNSPDILVTARVVDTQVLTASVVLGALVPVLAGGPEAEGVPRLVEGVAGVTSADHAAKVGGALLLTQAILVTTRVLTSISSSPDL